MHLGTKSLEKYCTAMMTSGVRDGIDSLLTRPDGQNSVRRSNGEALNNDCIQYQVTHGGGSVHVWGGVHYLGKTQLCI